MSHYSVAVFTKTGSEEEIKNQLARFREKDGDNLPKEWLTFINVEEEKRKEFETKTIKTFYCSSGSSWGQEVSKENYEKLSNKKIGDNVFLEIHRIGITSYFKKNKKYKCYYKKDNKCPDDKDYVWILVDEIIETSHPDKEVCFEGKISAIIINPPEDIALKDYYNNDFDLCMKDWYGIDEKENGKYGYWTNLLGYWDWYQIGGRFSNKLETINGKCDSARVKDIIFELNEQYKVEAAREWDLWVEKKQKTETELDKKISQKLTCRDTYLMERYKTKENYVYSTSRFSTYAFIFNRQWIAKGKMGWFGAGDDSFESEQEYYKKIDDIIKNNPELYLTIVDCHI